MESPPRDRLHVHSNCLEHVFMCVSMYVRTYISTYIHMFVCMYVHIYIYVYICLSCKDIAGRAQHLTTAV